MTPLTQRLKDAPWASEWPEGAVFGEINDKPQPSAWAPSYLEWSLLSAQKVMRAITEEGAPSVSVEQVHRTLNQLEEWTVRQRAFLTWPATPLGFARALVRSVEAKDEAVAVVVATYPAFCERMLEEARLLEPSLPEYTSLLGVKGYRKVVRSKPEPLSPGPSSPAPEAAVQAAKPESPVEPARSAPQADLPESPLRPDVSNARRVTRAQPVEKAEPSPLLLDWLERAESIYEPVLARQFIDQKIKENVQAHAGTPWHWFDQVFYPALLSLPEKKMGRLLELWPSQTQFKPGPKDRHNSIPSWFDTARPWVLFRDAGQDRQDLLVKGGFAALLDTSSLVPEEMPGFLEQLSSFAKGKSRVFSQRLHLWESLGGKLDEPMPDNELLSKAQVSTVREWVLAQDQESWKEAMEGAAPSLPASSRFQRGPGLR